MKDLIRLCGAVGAALVVALWSVAYNEAMIALFWGCDFSEDRLTILPLLTRSCYEARWFWMAAPILAAAIGGWAMKRERPGEHRHCIDAALFGLTRATAPGLTCCFGNALISRRPSVLQPERLCHGPLRTPSSSPLLNHVCSKGPPPSTATYLTHTHHARTRSTTPILAMLVCLYPMYAGQNACGSTALPLMLGIADRSFPAGMGRG